MRKYLYLLFSLLLVASTGRAQINLFEDYAALRPYLENKRLVLLGESDHYDYSSMHEKVKFIQYLHDSLGFEILAFESSIYEMNKVNQLIRGGAKVEDVIHDGLFSIWQHTPPIDSLINFLQQTQMQLAGFDNQLCSGNAGICLEFADALNVFLITNQIKVAPSLIDNISLLLQKVKSNDYNLTSDFKSQFQQDLLLICEEVRGIQSKEAKFIYQNLMSINGIFQNYYFDRLFEKTEATFKSEDSNVRDSLMAANLMYLLNTFPDKKIIAWGATYHFSDEVNGLTIENESMAKAKPMGQFLKNQIGDNMLIVGFTDLGKVPEQQTNEILEFAHLYHHQRAFLAFDSLNYTGKSSFLGGSNGNYPTGNWSNVLDIGIVINSNGKRKLTGSIINAEDNTAIPYAHIQLFQSSKGVVSNAHGNYEFIYTPKDDSNSIIVSCVGYLSDTIPLSRVTTKIKLIPDVHLLDEVMITASQNNPALFLKRAVETHLNKIYPKQYSGQLYYFSEEDSESSAINEAALAFSAFMPHTKGQVLKSAILNKRTNDIKEPFIPWPIHGLITSDFQYGVRLLNENSYKEMVIDSIFGSPNQTTIKFHHPKPTMKLVGMLYSSWSGEVVYDEANGYIKSKTQYFARDKQEGIIEARYHIDYMIFEGYVFPKFVTINYKYIRNGETLKGEEKALITELNLKSPMVIEAQLFEFDEAPYDASFWHNFNTLLLEN